MTTTREAEQATPPKGRLLRAIDAIFAQLWSWGGLYFLIAISLGLALWPLTDIPALKYIVKNDLSIVQRYRALIAVAISFVLTTATYLGIWLRRRRRDPGLTLPQSIVDTNRWAFVLLIAPMMTALAVPNIETKQPVFTGFLSLTITALAMTFIYRLLGLKRLRPPDDPFVPARWAGAAKAVFWAAFLGYTGLISYFALLDHWNLATTIYDLGIYDNTVWQTAHGFFLDCTFLRGGDHSVAHFDPFLWFIAQIYRVYERAETLLVLQTVWLASGVFPLWLLAKRRLKNEWMAAVLVLCYLLSPALHGINMFDFHSLALIVPNVMWAVYLLDVGGFKRYWLVIAVLLLTREDISLINCFIATYAILIGRTRTGLATVAVSLAYLVLIKLYAMPDPSLLMAASKGHSYAYYYQEMIYDRNGGNEQKIITGQIAPRQVSVFNLSGTSNGQKGYYTGDAGILGSGIVKGRAFRVASDLPVVAVQFNPIGGAAGYTTDASLLLPTHTLGKNHLHLGWDKGYGSGSTMAIVATEDATTVTITPKVNTAAGSNGLPAMQAGVATNVVINKYDYIQVTPGNAELSGSIIASTAPVALFGGHTCGNVPNTGTTACDHVEEQIFPLETWGKNYVAARNPKRANEPMLWRILASEDNTTITFDPPTVLGPQIMMSKGQMVEFQEQGDFYISANDPILVAGYMLGCTATGLPDCPGDPYMLLMVPVEQYQSDYVFLVDSSYTKDYAKLVRTTGSKVSVACLGGVVPENRWTKIGNSGYDWAVINMNPGEAMCKTGTNEASGDAGFGVFVSGTSSAASYAYPGGLALKPINPQ